jgi:hypothetical protein
VIKPSALAPVQHHPPTCAADLSPSPQKNFHHRSVLAEKPERVMKLFPSTAISAKGVYSVRLFRAGLPVDVILDDHFPCRAGKGVGGALGGFLG